MANVWFKLGVNPDGLSQECREGFRRFTWWWITQKEFGDVFVTSTDADTHLPWSYHYVGNAFDVQYPTTRNDLTEHEFQREIHNLLGPEWDVVFESTHIHIEMEDMP